MVYVQSDHRDVAVAILKQDTKSIAPFAGLGVEVDARQVFKVFDQLLVFCGSQPVDETTPPARKESLADGLVGGAPGQFLRCDLLEKIHRRGEGRLLATARQRGL